VKNEERAESVATILSKSSQTHFARYKHLWISIWSSVVLLGRSL